MRSIYALFPRLAASGWSPHPARYRYGGGGTDPLSQTWTVRYNNGSGSRRDEEKRKTNGVAKTSESIVGKTKRPRYDGGSSIEESRGSRQERRDDGARRE